MQMVEYDTLLMNPSERLPLSNPASRNYCVWQRLSHE